MNRNALYILSLSSIFMSGCRSHLDAPERAWAAKERAGQVSIHVILDKNSANFIKQNEMYFSIILASCNNNYEIAYPIEPYVSGRRASDFAFNVGGPTEFYGDVPERLFSYNEGECVYIRGGSYLGRKFLSGKIKVEFH